MKLFELFSKRPVSTHRMNFFIGLVAIVGLPIAGFSCGPRAVAEKAGTETGTSWKTVIVSEKEPGEALIISGRIFAPEGTTPLEGINLFVYQTDATGVYSTRAQDGINRNTRINGAMKTDAQGRYQFRTIKPGSYPGSRNPAHIHAYISGPGYPEYWIDDFLFADDPFVTDEVKNRSDSKGSFSSVLKLERGQDGALRGVRDIRIEKCSRNCTGR